MRRLEDKFHIDAPIDRVWDLQTDPRRWQEWDKAIAEITDHSERLDVVGARLIGVAKVVGRRLDVALETSVAERPRRFEQKVALPGGGNAIIAMNFAEAPEGGTDATFVSEYSLGSGIFNTVFERLMSGSMERDFYRTNRRFKALCEAAPAG